MVRTRADSSARKAVAAKAPRKQLGSSSGASSSGGACLGSPNSGKSKYGGGNAVKWWPAPRWQKGIGQFFSSAETGNASSVNSSTPSEEEPSSTQQATSTEEQQM